MGKTAKGKCMWNFTGISTAMEKRMKKRVTVTWKLWLVREEMRRVLTEVTNSRRRRIED